MTKSHAHAAHIVKHMNMVGSPLWGARPGPLASPKSGAESAVECRLFHLLKGLLTEMAEMTLSGEEGVWTEAQLPPK